MPCCVAVGCSTKEVNKNAEPPITLHTFPSDPEEKKKWIRAVRRENWTPSNTSRLCSKHFKEDDFDRSPFYSKLKKGVVPSIFQKIHSDHLLPHRNHKQPKREQRTNEQTSDEDFPESRTSSTPKQPPTKKLKELDLIERHNELLKLACDLLHTNCKQEETNECLNIGKVWGTKLMSLDPIQRRFAEKAIGDILFEADLGTLHRDSVQINSNHNSDPLRSP